MFNPVFCFELPARAVDTHASNAMIIVLIIILVLYFYLSNNICLLITRVSSDTFWCITGQDNRPVHSTTE